MRTPSADLRERWTLTWTNLKTGFRHFYQLILPPNGCPTPGVYGDWKLETVRAPEDLSEPIKPPTDGRHGPGSPERSETHVDDGEGGPEELLKTAHRWCPPAWPCRRRTGGTIWREVRNRSDVIQLEELNDVTNKKEK
jgi:hypothetical protein